MKMQPQAGTGGSIGKRGEIERFWIFFQLDDHDGKVVVQRITLREVGDGTRELIANLASRAGRVQLNDIEYAFGSKLSPLFITGIGEPVGVPNHDVASRKDGLVEGAIQIRGQADGSAGSVQPGHLPALTAKQESRIVTAIDVFQAARPRIEFSEEHGDKTSVVLQSVEFAIEAFGDLAQLARLVRLQLNGRRGRRH